MIKDSAKYYGAVFTEILDFSQTPISLERADQTSAGFYLLNSKTPIYIKYSTDRKSPWTFNFHPLHQKTQEVLYEKFSECLVVFVCGRDGIATLKFDEMKLILDCSSDIQGAVAIRRKHNRMYEIRGRDGVLPYKVSRRSLADTLENILV